jgi:hypothetical protein
MKRIAIVAITALTLLFPEPADAAVKAGQVCKKANQSATSNGKKFTCVKSGKKLVWKSAPSSKAIDTPFELPKVEVQEPNTPEQPQIEITSAAAAKIGTGCSFSGTHVGLYEGPAQCKEVNGQQIWSLIAKENDSVASRAYRYVLEKYLAAPSGNLAIDVRMDPNTPEWGKKIEKGLFVGARFWGTSPVGSAPVVTLISADLNWWPAQLDAVKDPGKDEYLKRLAASTCQAGFHGGPNPFWSFAFREANCVTNVGFKQVPAHEYTHYAQAVLSGSINGQKPRVPWMEEGLASFVGGALGTASDMGSDLRSNWASDLRGNLAAVDFFSKDERSVYESPKWGSIYPVGAIATEGLVALIGMDGVLKYYAGIKDGMSADQAMTNAFGLSVSKAAKLLDGYVISVSSMSEWSLAKLQSEWESAKKS